MATEKHILELLGQGDRDGAATLAIRSYGPRILGYLRPMLRDEEEVADAFSQWSERVWRGLAGFEGRSSVRTWCVRLACNVALNERHRAHRRRERRLATGEASAIGEEVRTRSAARLEARRLRLDELRRRLLPEEQTLLFLRLDQELPWDEVAAALSEGGRAVSADTASKRFERLKERLRGLVEAEDRNR